MIVNSLQVSRGKTMKIYLFVLIANSLKITTFVAGSVPSLT